MVSPFWQAYFRMHLFTATVVAMVIAATLQAHDKYEEMSDDYDHEV